MDTTSPVPIGQTEPLTDPAGLFPPWLAAQARFHAWTWKQGQNGKPTKLPLMISAKGSVRAGSLDGCVPLAAALAFVATAMIAGTITGGLGVQLGRVAACLYLSGIDLDECRSADGTIAEWALAIMRRFPSARWEVSPSGTGIKASSWC